MGSHLKILLTMLRNDCPILHFQPCPAAAPHEMFPTKRVMAMLAALGAVRPRPQRMVRGLGGELRLEMVQLSWSR